MSKSLGVLLSAILGILSFPVAIYSSNLVPETISAVVVWFAWLPIALALHDANPRDSFRWGYLFGLITNAGVFFWIIISMQKYGNLSIWVASSILITMIAELALYPALTFWTMARLSPVAPRWLTGTLLFSLLEWTRVYIPLEGFPWGTPAYGLYGALPLIQVGDLAGIFGLNLLVMLTNFTLCEVALWSQRRVRFPKTGVSLVLVFITASLAYGFVRIRHFRNSAPPTLSVGLVQGNIRQDAKWDEQYRFKILSTYHELTAQLAQHHPALIVWPEAALPMVVAADVQAFPFLIDAAPGADLVVGAATWAMENGREQYQNSAFVVAPNGKVRTRYDKVHLVPFGEYVPLSDILPMNRIVPAVAGNFAKGKGPVLAEVAGSKYGILICYELLFPDQTAELVKRGARFIVNITNDAWFDQTSGPYQHVRLGAFRAIETRRSVVRAANTGVSAWFDPTGRIHSATELFTSDVIIGDIPLESGLTFYVRHPNLFPLLAAGFLLLTSLGVFRPRRGDEVRADI